MELEHSFSVPVPVERAWDVLLDVERVAPCMPGASLDSVDGDNISGKIKVKVGPIQMTYAGTAKFTERDVAARVVTLEASGKETRGAGTASASVRSELKSDGDKTAVRVHTTLNVTGKPAQFGRGVLTEVGGRLIGIFADNLAAMLAAESASSREPRAGAAQAPAAATADQPHAGAVAPAADTTPDEALPIDVLNLSGRAWSSLRQDGIQTLGDLTRRTEQQLRAIENIGPASLADIKAKLADRGLGLAESADKVGATGPGTAPAAVPTVHADANGARPALGRHAGTEQELADVTPLRSARHGSPEGYAEREPAAWQPPDNEAIDLLGVAGLPVLKRAVPAAAVILGVLLLLLGIRRRRRSRRN